MTTNHFDKLDAALTRAGRIDIVKEILPPTAGLVGEYVSLFFSRPVPELCECSSMSKVQEICIQNKNDFNNCIKILSDA